MLDSLIQDYWAPLAALVLFAVSWGDQRRSWRDHRELTSQGFNGINKRLDQVNGNIARHESEIGGPAGLRERIKAVETRLED